MGGTVKVYRYKGQEKYFLRIALKPRLCETLYFDIYPSLSKAEADFRATMLACDYGFEREELPTNEIG